MSTTKVIKISKQEALFAVSEDLWTAEEASPLPDDLTDLLQPPSEDLGPSEN